MAQVGDIEKIRAGIANAPPPNDWSQYGPGFYVFQSLEDARLWKENRERLLGKRHSILTFDVPDEIWTGFSKRAIPETDDWHTPLHWMEDYDVLEGPWGYTPETDELTSRWQSKFNPHILPLLNQWLEEGEIE